MQRFLKAHPDNGKACRDEENPTINSRILRPRETLAINIPTNGDQEIHQAQYKIVQPPIHPLGW